MQAACIGASLSCLARAAGAGTLARHVAPRGCVLDWHTLQIHRPHKVSPSVLQRPTRFRSVRDSTPPSISQDLDAQLSTIWRGGRWYLRNSTSADFEG